MENLWLSGETWLRAVGLFLARWGLKLLWAILIFLLARIADKLGRKRLIPRLTPRAATHTRVLIQTLYVYGVYIVASVWVLAVFGVNPAGIFAALGLFSVGLGFAAQTSVSNLISGLFLLFERPFSVGDVIEVNGQVGIVLSIGLLSTRMRTFDNVLLRVPNENILKSTVKTFTAYEIRRIDLEVGISYDDDIDRAKEVIRRFLDENPVFLMEPEPIIMVSSLGDSAVILKVMVWIKRTDILRAKDTLVGGVKKALDEAGITIPYPQRVVHIVNPLEEAKAP